MLDKEKLILVHYVSVTGMPPQRKNQHLKDYREFVNSTNDGSILHYILPIKEGESRIEAINLNPIHIDGNSDELISALRGLKNALHSQKLGI